MSHYGDDCDMTFHCSCSKCRPMGPSFPDRGYKPSQELIDAVHEAGERARAQGLPNIVGIGDQIQCLDCGNLRSDKAAIENSPPSPGMKRCTCGVWVKEEDIISKKIKETFPALSSWPEKPLDPKKKGFDEVDKPSHYNQGEVECIDALASMLGPEGFKAYCQGSTFKYLWRYNYKGRPLQDLKKAKWYLERLISLQEES